MACSGRGASDADLRVEPADHPGTPGLPVRPHARVPRRNRPVGVVWCAAVHHAQHLEWKRGPCRPWPRWCGPGSLLPQRFSCAPVLGCVGGVRLRGGRPAWAIVAVSAPAAAPVMALCSGPSRRAAHPPAFCSADRCGFFCGAAPDVLAAIAGGIPDGMAGHLDGICDCIPLSEPDRHPVLLE